MSIAMASCGRFSGLCSGVRVIQKQPFSSHGAFRCSFAMDPFRRICILPNRLGFNASTIVPKASSATVEDKRVSETAEIPTPKVILDLDSDPDATVVEVTFGDRLGALLDTVCPLLLLIQRLSIVAIFSYLASIEFYKLQLFFK
nr:ACT domain-containing protein DS12, chloroplastic-like [Ipomoea batatas]